MLSSLLLFCYAILWLSGKLCSWGWKPSSFPPPYTSHWVADRLYIHHQGKQDQKYLWNGVTCHICLLVGWFVGLAKRSDRDLLTLWHFLTFFVVPWESANRRSVICLSTSGNTWLWKQGLTMYAARHTTEAQGILQTTEATAGMFGLTK